MAKNVTIHTRITSVDQTRAEAIRRKLGLRSVAAFYTMAIENEIARHRASALIEGVELVDDPVPATPTFIEFISPESEVCE